MHCKLKYQVFCRVVSLIIDLFLFYKCTCSKVDLEYAVKGMHVSKVDQEYAIKGMYVSKVDQVYAVKGMYVSKVDQEYAVKGMYVSKVDHCPFSSFIMQYQFRFVCQVYC
ncbi:hypothetical protein NPIL_585721 [Nephila pilipes]|uniref:Uncharacterized protein n=1 Tax=Nephila pilipes TaxID=299642 RepID=A0A8X6P553_NEPPI|nr:hypothetical protein NPIL_552121 [Nephila pilipes]GFU22128.1 hypothetical protein NPIL_585721 [Nephila pilipes]